MNIEPAFEANAQLAETDKPSMGAFDNPTMSSEPLLAFHPATRNTCRDAALLQILPVASKVVALVRVQFTGAFAWLTCLARRRRDSINRLLEGNRIMPVSTGDRDVLGSCRATFHGNSSSIRLAGRSAMYAGIACLPTFVSKIYSFGTPPISRPCWDLLVLGENHEVVWHYI
ncbi:hypothetical protein BamMEX5DRAFT_6134 [Burkholderia ambifaria MEX-5]|uniref:Uncharacterized protein n=1 Tax=Burkholderia ambifaria MEX-5 TaxID=396597 RepID=B1TEB8_9BURK|nr:hypothetical protein BamMEX5DRAFT_6134 [Burkholderia ambifaria MEX-5]